MLQGKYSSQWEMSNKPLDFELQQQGFDRPRTGTVPQPDCTDEQSMVDSEPGDLHSRVLS